MTQDQQVERVVQRLSGWTEKKHLEWGDLKALRQHSAKHWTPRLDVAAYFNGYRAPSNAWPNSYANAARTMKFAAWLRDNTPGIARQVGL